jgi:membrane fusion protein, multidrug efflux system
VILAAMLLGCQRQVAAGQEKQNAVPVVVASADVKDVPVELRAVGSVQAYSTVAVKAEITGELTGVFFQDGMDVKAGDLLFTIDRRPSEAALSQAQANLARDTSQRENAAAQLERTQLLFNQGIVPKEQLDQATSSKDALDAVIQADEAAIDNAKLQLQYCTIYAPIAGRTGNLMVNKGNLVKSGDATLVTINQIQPVYVFLSVPETSLADIQKYMASGPLPVLATRPNQPPESGNVTFVDNAVDPTTGTIKLRATFPNHSETLWPGQFLDLVVTITTKRGALVVPSQAIQNGDAGQYVYVVKQDHTVQNQPVRVEMTVNGQAVIAEGLRPGDQVVTDGQSRLTPGLQVDVGSAAQ